MKPDSSGRRRRPGVPVELPRKCRKWLVDRQLCDTIGQLMVPIYPRAARLSDVSTECVADTLGAEAFSPKFEHL